MRSCVARCPLLDCRLRGFQMQLLRPQAHPSALLAAFSRPEKLTGYFVTTPGLFLLRFNLCRQGYPSLSTPPMPSNPLLGAPTASKTQYRIVVEMLRTDTGQRVPKTTNQFEKILIY